MATVVGRHIPQSTPLAQVDSVPTHYMKGTLLKPNTTNPLAGGVADPNLIGAPFDTQAPIPFIVYDGDESKGTRKIYEVSAEALQLVKQVNTVPGGRATKDTLSWEEAVKRVNEEKQKQLMPPGVFVAASPAAPVPPVPAAVLPNVAPTPPQVAPQPVSLRPPKTLVTFKGRFGEFEVPYDLVFVEGIALVLVQNQIDGVRFKPPMDAQEPILIAWGGQQVLCYSGVSYRMPDGLSAHTVYLIDTERTEAEFNGGKV